MSLKYWNDDYINLTSETKDGDWEPKLDVQENYELGLTHSEDHGCVKTVIVDSEQGRAIFASTLHLVNGDAILDIGPTEETQPIRIVVQYDADHGRVVLISGEDEPETILEFILKDQTENQNPKTH